MVGGPADFGGVCHIVVSGSNRSRVSMLHLSRWISSSPIVRHFVVRLFGEVDSLMVKNVGATVTFLRIYLIPPIFILSNLEKS